MNDIRRNGVKSTLLELEDRNRRGQIAMNRMSSLGMHVNLAFASMEVVSCYAERCLVLRRQAGVVLVRRGVAGFDPTCMLLTFNRFRKHLCQRMCEGKGDCLFSEQCSWKWPVIAPTCSPPKRAPPVGGGTLEHVMRTW